MIELNITKEYEREQEAHWEEVSSRERHLTEGKMDEKILSFQNSIKEARDILKDLYNSHVKSRDEDAERYIADMLKFAYDEFSEAESDLERLLCKSDEDGYIF